MIEYDKVLDQAAQKRWVSPHEKEQVYLHLRNKLADMTLPVSFEQAIREMCRRLEY